MYTASGFPTVVGFDLPGLQDGPGPSRVIVSALLDAPPGDDWMRVLDRLAWPTLRLDHGVEQLRLVGQGIHFVGDIRDGRGLSAAVRELFDLVTAKVLSARMAALEHPVDDLALALPPLAPMLVSQDPRLADVAALLQLPALPALLELASRLTGMRFVAVARVTDERWTACAVHDLLGFGLQPGQDLVLETTICDEIRQHQRTVQFDHASAHPVFSTHPTPAMYGFESYLSVPMFRRDGSLFGTLCALDPRPSQLDALSVKCFEVLAAWIGAQMELDDAHVGGDAAQTLHAALQAVADAAAGIAASAQPSSALQEAAQRIRALSVLPG
ncbi:GAF domain-containing protein [Stenotrophomonas rhizophila]|uniref:GAF domain-containing protein n=1 Tax=Stenotrophomonas rhizophila TaxID=216778 RepID=UPI0028A9AA50|nr:GAF domain-containing protein [Stenotrophomonas rhizophila]